MRVRGKGHRQFKSFIDFRFAVAPDEAIEGAPQEFPWFTGARLPIARIGDSEFNKNSGEAY